MLIFLTVSCLEAEKMLIELKVCNMKTTDFKYVERDKKWVREPHVSDWMEIKGTPYYYQLLILSHILDSNANISKL